MNGQRRPAQGEMLLKLDGKGLPQFRVCGEHSDVAAAAQTGGGGDAEAGNDDEGDAFVQRRQQVCPQLPGQQVVGEQLFQIIVRDHQNRTGALCLPEDLHHPAHDLLTPRLPVKERGLAIQNGDRRGVLEGLGLQRRGTKRDGRTAVSQAVEKVCWTFSTAFTMPRISNCHAI